MTLTLLRLASSGIRSRVPASILTVLVTGAAAATIVIALSLGSTIAEPWQHTFDVANGAHVQAIVPSESDAQRIAQLPGIAYADAPMPVAQADMLVNGKPTRVFVVGLSGQELVNTPVVTGGAAPNDGSVLLERSLAEAIHANRNATLALQSPSGTMPLDFAGEAIVPSQPRYPRSNPGLVWVTRATFERVFPDATGWRWIENIRLGDAAGASQFVASASSEFPSDIASFETWQDMRTSALQEAQPFQVILIGYLVLLLVVSVAVIGIIVGARAANQAREIAVLKTIGFTPRQIAATYALEVIVLAMVGALLGFIPAVMIAPSLARASASTLLATPQTSISFSRLAIAITVVIPVAGAAAYRSARCNARVTIAQALRPDATPLRPASWLRRLGCLPALPVPAMLGLRDLIARRRRIVWLLLVILLTGSALVATICAQAAIAKATAGEITDIPRELPSLIYSLDGVLAISAISALVAVALLMVRERVREIGILRTIGMAPRQVVATVAGALALVALLAGLLAIPAGLGLYILLYTATNSDGAIELAPWWSLAAAPLVLVIATAVFAGIPAHLAARVPVAQTLRQDG